MCHSVHFCKDINHHTNECTTQSACRHAPLNTHNQTQNNVKIYYIHTETHITLNVRIIRKLLNVFYILLTFYVQFYNLWHSFVP